VPNAIERDKEVKPLTYFVKGAVRVLVYDAKRITPKTEVTSRSSGKKRATNREEGVGLDDLGDRGEE